MVVGLARLWDPPIRPARETRQSEDAPTRWDQPVRFGGPPVRFVGLTTAAQAQLTKILYLKVCGVGYKHKDRCSLVARRGCLHREVLGSIPSPRGHIYFATPPARQVGRGTRPSGLGHEAIMPGRSLVGPTVRVGW
jgi:hypothetical protein